MSFYDDGMEVGSLVPVGPGQWLDKNTGYTVDEDGRVFDSDGNLVEDNYYDDDEEDR